MARYAYARWANDRIKRNSPEYQEEIRKTYFSPQGKIGRYDEYAKWCRVMGYDFDDNPEGYWEYKAGSLDKGTGYLLGAIGVLVWFVMSLVTGSTGRKEQ